MTDREALEALLSRYGLVPYEGVDDRVPGVDGPRPGEVLLVAEVGGVKGYGGFLARFEFDDLGGFQSFGVWE